MGIVKTYQEIQVMKEGGKIAAYALDSVLNSIKEGISTKELDQIAEQIILNNHAKPSFKKVKGYMYSTCINLNEGLVHGIPNERVIKRGDLVKVDLGVFYRGFNTDLSYSVEVGANNQKKFLTVGESALNEAIKKCVVGGRVGDISSSIQQIIESNGYSVSRELVGHGVGRLLHEPPSVPGYGVAHTGVILKEGMTLAVEVIYQKGSPEIEYEKDGWTIITKDRSLAGLFEHTVAITKDGPLVLTLLTG